MLRMLLSALRGLKNALLWALDWCLWIVALPLRALGPPTGQSAVPPPPAIATEASAPASTLSHAPSSRLAAAAAVNWAQARLRNGRAAGLPPATIPEVARGWLMTLREPELRIILRAGYQALSGHLSGRTEISGLLPVRPRRSADMPAGRKRVASETPEREPSYAISAPAR